VKLVSYLKIPSRVGDLTPTIKMHKRQFPLVSCGSTTKEMEDSWVPFILAYHNIKPPKKKNP